MVTTTVRMVNGLWKNEQSSSIQNESTNVHGNTTDARPAVALRLVLVVGTASLEDGLVDTATAGNDSDHSTVD